MKRNKFVRALSFVGLSLIFIIGSIIFASLAGVDLDPISYTIGVLTAFAMLVTFAIIFYFGKMR